MHVNSLKRSLFSKISYDIPPLFKTFRDGKFRHDGRVIDGIIFNLIDISNVLLGLRDVCEDLIHLGGLHPFLFGMARREIGIVRDLCRCSGRSNVRELASPIYKVTSLVAIGLTPCLCANSMILLVHLALFGIDGTISGRIVRFMTLRFR